MSHRATRRSATGPAASRQGRTGRWAWPTRCVRWSVIGRRQCGDVGHRLVTAAWCPSWCWSPRRSAPGRPGSWSARRWATSPEPEVVVTDDLYDAGPRDVLALLRDVDERVASVLVVGHEPTMSVTARCSPTRRRRSGDLGQLHAGLPTAGYAVLEVAEWARRRPRGAPAARGRTRPALGAEGRSPAGRPHFGTPEPSGRGHGRVRSWPRSDPSVPCARRVTSSRRWPRRRTTWSTPPRRRHSRPATRTASCTSPGRRSTSPTATRTPRPPTPRRAPHGRRGGPRRARRSAGARCWCTARP